MFIHTVAPPSELPTDHSFNFQYNKIKTELEQLLNENMNLRNHLRATQSQNTILTDEVKSARSAAANLNSEIGSLKDELAVLQAQHDRIQLENENFRRNDETRMRKIDELIEERRRIAIEMEKVKGSGVVESARCSVPEHEKCEGILRQNAVLQEVVKALRKERNGEVEDVRVAEQRLDRLEMLLCQLKNVF